MRKEKKEDKVRTTIDIDREVWAFVKSEATIRKTKASHVVEEVLKEAQERKIKRYSRKDET